MDDYLTRFWSDLISRVGGPFTFRFILQPVMAAFFAARDGVKDARDGRPPYAWAIAGTSHRRELLREGLTAVTRVTALGVVMDAAYQLIVFRRIYPLELIVIVLLLAFVPYLLVRGPANRIARWLASRRVSG